MASQVLANGWVSAVDPGSGRTYYANTITGATAWEFPAELAALVPLPPGWIEATDPGSGRSYYVESATGKTTWERPVAEPTPAPPPPPAPTPLSGGPPVPVALANGGGAVVEPVKKKMSNQIKAHWRRVLDWSRTEATSKIASKNKKFFGLRKFAETAARKKKEAAMAKKVEAEAEAEAEREAAAAVAAKAKRSIMSLLEVDPPTVDKKNIEEYAEEKFELNRKGLFGAKTTVTKILSWKNEMIKKALLKMPTRELESTATQCFRNVTGFMGDRSTNKEDSGHAEKLLKVCLHAPEELRDEIFCQIIKQTTNNPSPESVLKGWQLLAIVSGTFAPSADFQPYLLSYCDAHKEDGGGVGAYAKYTVGRVVKTASLGPRREIPTTMEIEASAARLPVLVRVYHLDGTFDTLPVTSWVTPSVLKSMVCEKRGILDGEAFAIYEMTPDGEERFLESDERILDLVAYWQRLFEEEKSKTEEGGGKKKKKKATGADFYRIVFKVHMYFEPAIEDKAAQHEMYIQAVYDVVSARYPCGERDCLVLAAMQLQQEYGDAGLPDLPHKLVRFLPSKYAESTRGAELASEIRKHHAGLAGKSSLAAETDYLTYVKEWQVYGSSFFFVQPQMNVELPEEVFLAVNPKGVLIINPETKEVLATHPYSEIPTWGHSGTSFVLHIGNLIKQSKLYFATEEGRTIGDLVRAYVNHLVT